ncbi:MAG TPA: hypothetical protein VMM15_29480 [Bradyrhizobium sp.]|nr:hypothetical protein [Bradyrhizobium sp.]
MFAQFGASFAAVCSACERHCRRRLLTAATLALAAAALAGCLPATVPVSGADPADPAARTAHVDYRSTIAPYTSLRPTAPAPWRDRNNNVAPSPKSDR